MNTSVLLSTLCIAASAALLPADARADPVDISEWPVPWERSRPRDPDVASDGRVWFVGQQSDYIANFEPETGDFNRYDLDPGTGPHTLLVDAQDHIWYAANRAGFIGLLDPGTAHIVKITMPDRDADDPHTLAFDGNGNIWFTVQQGNFVGRLAMADHTVQLMKVPTRRAHPYGIVVNANGIPWVAEFGSHKLIRVDPEAMRLEEIELPDEDSRPRRLVVTSDGNVWYGDYERGFLGRYEPDSGRFAEWPLPGGEDSRPYGMAVDRFDRIWLVETGVSPNRLVGFDTAREAFFSVSDIPSGGGSVRNMVYFEPAGEVWFGTDANTIGRAKLH
ncbi:MAG TPA: lyase [Woeseiaceae bacterium]|nr:lyase [Woeseiaceae bacterium]